MQYLLYIPIFAARLVYAVVKIFTSSSADSVLLISRDPLGIPEEFVLLQKQIHERRPEAHVTVLDHGTSSLINNAVYFFIQMRHIAQSQTVVIERYVPSIGVLNHRNSTQIIQMWHTLGALKKFGWAAAGTDEGISLQLMKIMGVHNNYTYVLAPDQQVAEVYQEAFGVDTDRIVVCTHPRQELIRKYKKPSKSKKTTKILYAPTFRRSTSDYIDKFVETTKILNETYEITIRLHPLEKTNPDDIPERYQLASPNGSFVQMLANFDVLITDYSASVFEARELEIPVLLFRPDKADYSNKRGLFDDPKWLENAEVLTAQDITHNLPGNIARPKQSKLPSALEVILE